MIDSIYIENFRRIGKAFIPLRDGITVLSGDNGTGKSTIIEALLFNQYGKPKDGTTKDSIPRSNRADGELAYTSVDFTHDGMHYRCRRYITAKGSTLATLYSYTDEQYDELMRQDDIRHLDKKLGTAVATSTTGVTAAITQLMGLDYAGYKASLVATQKELDSLANLTRDKRKQFFLDLLGYSRLDKIRRESAKELSEKTGMRDGMMRQSYNRKDLERHLESVTKELADVQARYDKGKSLLDDVFARQRQAEDAYDGISKRHEAMTQAKADNQEDVTALSSLKSRRATIADDIKAHEQAAADYDGTSTYAERLAQAKERLSRAKAYANAKAEVNRLTDAIAEDNDKLSKLQEREADIASRHGEMPDLDKRQAVMSDAQQRMAVARHNVTDTDSSVRSMERLISDVDAGRIAKCPTCGSEISSADGRRHLEGELTDLRRQYDDARAQVPIIQAELNQASASVSDAKAALRTWHDDEKSLASIKREIDILKSEIEDTHRLLSSRESRMNEMSADAMSRSETFGLEDEIARLTDMCTKEAQARAAYERIAKDRQNLAVIDSSIADTQARIDARKDRLADEREVERQYQKASAERDALRHKAAAYQDRLSQLAERRGQLTSDAGVTRDNIKTAERQERDTAKLSEDIEVLTGVRATIDDMRETLPARITPSLSEEASRLLEIATGGAYSMLEIDDEYDTYIYTDDGKRPMAQMSGGEQDIASLCIRIAIAEAILESTGTPSQTLVLDEIFGALDDSRKQEACDALRHLNNVLPRILCITHVDQIKDMADWTFVVEKDENGTSGVREIDNGNVMKAAIVGTEDAA